jgi:hypothetical protein
MGQATHSTPAGELPSGSRWLAFLVLLVLGDHLAYDIDDQEVHQDPDPKERGGQSESLAKGLGDSGDEHGCALEIIGAARGTS